MSLLIPTLLRSCCPATVARFVISASVRKSIDFFSERTNTHVREKIRECVPSRANLNSGASVSRESARFWIFAAIDHVAPDVVSRSSRKSMGDLDAVLTSAIFPMPDRFAGPDFQRSTSASATPVGVACAIFDETDYSPISEFHSTAQFDRGFHDFGFCDVTSISY
jgi:hypothetical protein